MTTITYALNDVEPVRFTRDTVPASVDQMFEAVVSKRWPARLLERWLWNRLRTRVHQKSMFRSTAIDGPDLIHKLRLSKRDMRMLWDREARYLLIGIEQIRDLLGDIDKMPFMQFEMQGELMQDGLRRFYGLKVVTIPWMRGWVLVPELGGACDAR